MGTSEIIIVQAGWECPQQVFCLFMSLCMLWTDRRMLYCSGHLVQMESDHSNPEKCEPNHKSSLARMCLSLGNTGSLQRDFISNILDVKVFCFANNRLWLLCIFKRSMTLKSPGTTDTGQSIQEQSLGTCACHPFETDVVVRTEESLYFVNLLLVFMECIYYYISYFYLC